MGNNNLSGRFALSGAIAGAGATLAFTLIHGLLISDVSFTLAMMLPAGAACGALVAWSYAFLARRPSVGGWLFYNFLYLGMFFLLTAVTFGVFEPQTTMAAVMVDNGIYWDMIGRAMPVTAVFTLASAVVMTLIYDRSLQNLAVLTVTCSVLMLILGHNISAMGLVAIPRSGYYLVAEMLGLILAINGVYVLVFVLLERKRLAGREGPTAGYLEGREAAR
jgi:hypothetical protein